MSVLDRHGLGDWLADRLVEIGEIRRARHLCERLLSLASPLGLYAEELDPVSGRHLGNFPQAYNSGPPIFRGLYEDNDPKKRLMMVVNYNTDISQYWEWSGRGLRPFDETNEAYKLGVNYIVYGMTH